MSTGENEQALRKIIDMTIWMSISILLLHYYYQCYTTFKGWSLSWPFFDSILNNITRTGLFNKK
ncbi:YWFCY domain-containing protein [Sphingobacterium sp. KU25419]|nr:YWFCY domain-containing protein [Sphingobacterium sp. KU25419]